MDNKDLFASGGTFMDKLKSSLLFRIVMIGVLILLLLIPFAMIQSLINEREYRKRDVINEISSKWALDQVVNGPILDLPFNHYTETETKDEKGNKQITVTKEQRTAHILPDELTITGQIEPEIRYRGIYKVTVYKAALVITGMFRYPDLAGMNIPEKDVLFDKAALTLGVSDMRGISAAIDLLWNNAAITFKPGVPNNDVLAHGIYSNVALQKENTFSIKLNINGSASLGLIPIGKITRVHLASDWQSPSFDGLFLPKTHNITDKGFTADWEIFDFNRDFPQQWINKEWELNSGYLQVKLFASVDEYQKITRSAKYALLFIALTFLICFLIMEIFNRIRIHPIQYLLVGFAICLFYLLLLSLSEHMLFNLAYLIASAAVVALIVAYMHGVFKKVILTALTAITLVLLYSFLFIILQLEDYALLLGSVGLFAILGTVMLITRKLDWYALKIKKEDKAP